MSKIEVNAIEPQCGTNLTVGASGDTITFPSGTTVVNNGSQTGFGRTGTVDWDTTAKTASFTAVSGNGYFVNTTSAAITLTLPASPSAGDIVAFKDYAYTFATNNLTVDGNGSPIGGTDGTILPTYSTNGTSKTFIYVDGTKGWLVTNESTDTSQEINELFVTATGGTVTCCGDYKIHTFTGPGTFCVSCAGNASGSNTVDYLVVAGGGSGGSSEGGGGGAGGFRESSGAASGCYTASPLGACVAALPVSVQGYPIIVGGGGASRPCTPSANGNNGSNSVFSTITSAGGGGGGSNVTPAPNTANSGGSGGGARRDNGSPVVGAGNTPPVSPPQGNNGGSSPATDWKGSGGGGGATAVGANGTSTGPGPAGESGGDGGAGGTTSISASPVAYAGGGGGSINGSSGDYGLGGTGGGGNGSSPGTCATAGTTNRGGGGGGATSKPSGAGGSGIVIIRYKFQ